MTLKEMAAEYRRNCEVLSARAKMLRKEAKQTDDPFQKSDLESRAKLLATMYREGAAAARQMERYSEPKVKKRNRKQR